MSCAAARSLCRTGRSCHVPIVSSSPLRCVPHAVASSHSHFLGFVSAELRKCTLLSSSSVSSSLHNHCLLFCSFNLEIYNILCIFVCVCVLVGVCLQIKQLVSQFRQTLFLSNATTTTTTTTATTASSSLFPTSHHRGLSSLLDDYVQGKFDRIPLELLERLSAELAALYHSTRTTGAEDMTVLVNTLRTLLHAAAPPFYTSTILTLTRTLIRRAPATLPLLSPLLSVSC